MKKNLALFLFSLLFFVVLYGLSFLPCVTITNISISLFSDNPDRVKVYFSFVEDSPVFNEVHSSSYYGVSGKQKETAVFPVSAVRPEWLRVDPALGATKVKIYHIVLRDIIGREVVIPAAEIFENLNLELSHNVEIKLDNGCLAVEAVGDDPYFVFKVAPWPFAVPWFVLVSISILSFYFYRFIACLPLSSLLSFVMPGRIDPSDKSTIYKPLDGLRGLAALLVLAEHTLPSFLGAGHSGVLIFFVMSGFLLARPFIINPEKAFKLDYLIEYGQRRLKRIAPMFYSYIFVVYLMNLRLSEFLFHAIFIKGNGHLWAIPQEMAFYLFFPLLFIFNYLVFRKNIYCFIALSLALVFYWQRLFPVDIFHLYGMRDQMLPLKIPVFLVGVCFSALFFVIWQKKLKITSLPLLSNHLLSLVALLIIVCFVFFSNGYLLNHSNLYSMEYELLFSFLAGLLLFIIIATDKNIVTMFLANPLLCSLGVVSYSFYLIHPLIINFAKLVYPGSSKACFIITLIVGYFCSCATYRFVEKPFLRHK